jgi:Fic family protein
MLAALIRGIEEKRAQLDRLRPLAGGALAQLQKYYDVELTYTSNAIEGNTLTHRETAEIIEHGIMYERLDATLDEYLSTLQGSLPQPDPNR